MLRLLVIFSLFYPLVGCSIFAGEALGILLEGSPRPAEIDGMVVDCPKENFLRDARLKTRILVSNVSHEWKNRKYVELIDSRVREALEKSLDSCGILSKYPSDAKLSLSVHIEKLHWIYLDDGNNEGNAETVITYKICDMNTYEIYLQENIVAAFPQKYDLSFWRNRRARLSVEGSVRKNISQFLLILMEKKDTLFKPNKYTYYGPGEDKWTSLYRQPVCLRIP